jgi:hypothetical protein
MAAHACALAVAPCLHYAILFLSGITSYIYWSARPRPLEQGRQSVWTLQKVADFEYLSVFQSFRSFPSFLLILRMEESKTCEAGPNLSSSSTDSSRNFRDAVMGSKKPDRAMELLRAHVLSKFIIPRLKSFLGKEGQRRII